MTTAAAPTTTEQFEKIRTVDPPDGCRGRDRAGRGGGRTDHRPQSRRAERPCWASPRGSTPVPFYRELIRLHREEGLSFSRVVTFNLDEYHGLGRRPSGELLSASCASSSSTTSNMRPENIHIPDGTVPLDKVDAHCQRVRTRHRRRAASTCRLLGIGRTGHIGFNEPGSTRDSRTRLIALDRITRQDAAADFFGEDNVPRSPSRWASAPSCAPAKSRSWPGAKTRPKSSATRSRGRRPRPSPPAFSSRIPAARFLVDAAAAKALTRVKLPWLVSHVAWDETSTRRAVTWLALEHHKPVLKLLDEEYNENGMAELLTRPRARL